MIKKNSDNNNWSVYIVIRGKTGVKKQKRFTSVPSRAEAQRLEDYWRAKLREECDLPADHIFETWVERFFEKIAPTFKASTIDNYKCRYKRYISNAAFVTKKLKDITTTDIFDLIKSKEVSEHTKKSIIKDLKAIFQKAIDEGIISRNPASPIKIKVPDSKLAVLNTPSVQRLINSAKKDHHPWYPIWAVAVTTGMRNGELYSLKWTDVDFENNQININSSWTIKNGYGSTKNSHNRVVPLSADLRKLLKELKLKSKSEFVLPHHEEWTYGYQAQILKAYCNEIKITEVRFHDLRATFITQMLLAGVSLAKVMAIVGHADLKTTNRYLRILGTDLQGATDELKFKLPGDEILAEVINIKTKLK